MASLLVLGLSVAVLFYLLIAFAHARVAHADLQELQRLQDAGLLNPSLSAAHDFRAICELLDSIAPAIYMRQELWIKLYFYTLRCGSVLARHKSLESGMEREITRLAAYEATLYRIACSRLAAIR